MPAALNRAAHHAASLSLRLHPLGRPGSFGDAADAAHRAWQEAAAVLDALHHSGAGQVRAKVRLQPPAQPPGTTAESNDRGVPVQIRQIRQIRVTRARYRRAAPSDQTHVCGEIPATIPVGPTGLYVWATIRAA